jgi:hypothetical protein
MLERVCTSMCDGPVTCLESKELEESIIILRRVGIECSNKAWEMLLSNARCGLPVQAGGRWSNASSR